MALQALLIWMVQAVALCVVFTGAGLYLRGFWVYFRAVRWLRLPDQAAIRRRYRSSTLAAIVREPGLAAARGQMAMGVLGLPLIVVGGVVFNAIRG